MSDASAGDERAILDRMTDAFFALDTDRRFTYLNDRGRDVICEAIGADLSIEELRGRHIWEEIPEAVDTTFYEQYERAVETQEPVAFEDHYEPLNTWFQVRAYPSESGLSVYFQDITNHKRRERRLRRQAQQFAGFGDVLSHDLKNPLNVAMGRLDLARETGDLDQLDAVADSLSRIETLIDDITTAMEEGALVNDISTVEVEAVVRSVWDTTETADASLVFGETGSIRADESALVRLLENLVKNAIEHGGDAVTVRVGTVDDGLYVEDDGPGVPDEDVDDIFEPTYTTKEGETGFGMVSVRQIALAHGWDVAVTESPEGGARFEFTDVETV